MTAVPPEAARTPTAAAALVGRLGEATPSVRLRLDTKRAAARLEAAGYTPRVGCQTCGAALYRPVRI